uniref:Uncharacterized protein n=2 Tax=Anopheles albimanus TaxID=7167 RepID=A0A182FX90_ANOAL
MAANGVDVVGVGSVPLAIESNGHRRRTTTTTT